MIVLEAKAISKVYGGRGTARHQALDGVDLQVKEGEFVGIMGPSGSGKTTLLNILATIDQPTAGVVKLRGTNPRQLRGDRLALFRRRQLGFIFQDYNLLDTLSIRDNIILPLALDRVPGAEIERKLEAIAHNFHIEHILDKRPSQTSGGEQQRAAAARALIHEPMLVLADEPTGNLDSKAAKELMEILSRQNEERGVTITMVTHDPLVASYCQRILFIRDGRSYSEVRRGNNRQAFYQQILDVLSLMGGSSHDPASLGHQQH
ncbi:MAG: ABC transporter ATP-binding protein [Firmicutes bacterium]|nr:ABC transporter ATP-binding protein [Bacillota bacterium]